MRTQTRNPETLKTLTNGLSQLSSETVCRGSSETGMLRRGFVERPSPLLP